MAPLPTQALRTVGADLGPCYGASLQVNPYGGGSNFSSHGNTFHTQTTVVDSTFPEVEDPVEMIVQLVNNESEEELIHFTRQLQSQVDGAKREEIERMEREKAQLEAALIEKNKVNERSKLFGHSEQQAHLM